MSSAAPLAPADAALRALSPSQLAFLERLPKAELHAHLNGSIPLPLLQELAREYVSSAATGDDGDTTTNTTTTTAEILARVQHLQTGVELDAIDDFFPIFSAVYALTSTPASLKRATRAILSHFLDPQPTPTPAPASASAPQVNGKASDGGGGRAAVKYLELRTTPRATPHMSFRIYLETVLGEVEARAPDAAALIVCLDRRMTPEIAREVLELALQLRREGRRVIGVDLCGDPAAVRLCLCNPLSRAFCQPPSRTRSCRVVGWGVFGQSMPSRLRRDAQRNFFNSFWPLCS